MLSKIFYPESILILGVSNAPDNLGRNIAANLVEFGFGGEIYLYGRRGGNLFGHRIHTNLDEVPDGIDLAVVLLPAQLVPEAIEKIGIKGIKHAVIETGGFAERGEVGGVLQEKVREIAEKYGIRVVGPNCIGVMNPEMGLATAFLFVRKMWREGEVSVIAQSGGVGVSYLYLLASENIGISKFASIGNKMNTDEKDYLEYLIGDPNTKIIVMYLENITKGREFFNLLKSTTKPVLIQKANRTEAGKKIAFSHTAALAQDDEVASAAIWQARGLVVNSITGMMNHIKSFLLPPLKGNRIGIVARSGGHAVISADSANENGFVLPEFDLDILSKINSLLPAGIIKRQNPLDLGDLYNFDLYAQIMTEIIRLEYIDAIVMVHEYFAMLEWEESRKLIPQAAKLSAEFNKPVYLVLVAEEEEIASVKKRFNYPIFSSIEETFQAMQSRYRHDVALRRKSGEESAPRVYDFEKAAKVIAEAKRKGKRVLTDEGYEILKAYSIRCPRYVADAEPETVLEKARSMNFPVALKVLSEDAPHKSDLGLVRLNLKDFGQLETEIKSAMAKHTGLWGGDKKPVFLIQEMFMGGREFIVGGRQDPNFGAVLMAGTGGIFVETLRDITLRLCPVTTEEAEAMLLEIKGGTLLGKVRGMKEADSDALKEIMVNLSHLLNDFPEIREIDLNPVIVGDEGCGAVAVDVRMVIN